MTEIIVQKIADGSRTQNKQKTKENHCQNLKSLQFAQFVERNL